MRAVLGYYKGFPRDKAWHMDTVAVWRDESCTVLQLGKLVATGFFENECCRAMKVKLMSQLARAEWDRIRSTECFCAGGLVAGGRVAGGAVAAVCGGAVVVWSSSSSSFSNARTPVRTSFGFAFMIRQPAAASQHFFKSSRTERRERERSTNRCSANKHVGLRHGITSETTCR